MKELFYSLKESEEHNFGFPEDMEIETPLPEWSDAREEARVNG